VVNAASADVVGGHDHVVVEPVTVEHHRMPLGIGEPAPRLSWVTHAPAGWVQYGAELRFATPDGVETRAVEGAESVLVAWPFEPLRSRERGELSVRVRNGTAYSDWSAPSAIEAGLFGADDWAAQAIGPGWETPGEPRQPALLRTGITLAATPRRARLYASAHGLYRFEINGRRVGDDELAPGWTSYSHRVRYSTYDVTELLADGENALGAWLADGWYRGRLGFHGGHVDLYGDQTALLGQLEVEYDDGRSELFGTGTDWLSTRSPITGSSLLDGESFDARLLPHGWSRAGFTADGWTAAAPRDFDLSRLTAPDGPPVRCTEEIPPVSSRRTPDGRLIVDFGQNVVGRLRISASAFEGAELRIRHAEVLTPDGELATRPLRGAAATDTYVFAGHPGEAWEPAFTIHGFRYAELTGWRSETADGVVARVLHTDMRRTGTFECSDPLLKRLHENVVWSMRGNFVDIPTDCPQRDERLGWTGDIQVFAPTANFLYDGTGLLVSWLKDLALEQHDDGTVPWFVPEIPGGEQWTPARPGAGWGDAAVLVPWELYRATGDREVLRRQYDSARAWSDLQHRLARPDDVWDGSYQLGDWLDPTAPPDDPAAGLTDRHLVATAYYHRSAWVLAQIAAELDMRDVDTLILRAAASREGFRRRYRIGTGRLASESQAAYAIAIAFGLFDADELPEAGRRLAALVRAADLHLTTGFLGTPLLLDALTDTGHFDLAAQLLGQDTLPSWLYPVTMGATTIWERWDSLLPTGDVNPGDMTSFNHYAFGAVADWMHRRLAGLEASSPAWRTITFRPGLRSGLESASAAKMTPYGLASISWVLDGDRFVIDLVVPTGVTAELITDDAEEPLASGQHRRYVPR
jgi:alpha-L-rhamnosidase